MSSLLELEPRLLLKLWQFQDLYHVTLAKYPNSSFQITLDLLNGLLALVAFVVYVVDTYVNIDQEATLVYLVSSCLLTPPYLVGFLSSRNKLEYLLGYMTLIDLAAMVYGYANFFLSSSVSNLTIMRIIRLVQVVKFLRMVITVLNYFSRRIMHPMMAELYKRVTDLFVTVVGVLLIMGCIFFELESNSDSLGAPEYWHQAIYFSAVTMSTIGYGDFHPTMALTQMLISLNIFVLVVILPIKANNLASLLQDYTVHERMSFSASASVQHVVLLGHLTPDSVSTFIHEFFHTDRGVHRLALVVMVDHKPSPEFQVVCTSTSHRSITLLQGTAYSTLDLMRARIHLSSGIFVMCDKGALLHKKTDRGMAMMLLSISSFISQLAGRGCRTLSRPQYWRVYDAQGMPPTPVIITQLHCQSSWDRASRRMISQIYHPPQFGLLPLVPSTCPVILGPLKHTLMGAAANVPGLATFITNIAMTVHDLPEEVRKMNVDEAGGIGWLSDYWHGASAEVYEIKFPPSWNGMTFTDAAAKLYHEFDAVLMGLRSSSSSFLELAPFRKTWTIESEKTFGYILSHELLALFDVGEKEQPSFTPVAPYPSEFKRGDTEEMAEESTSGQRRESGEGDDMVKIQNGLYQEIRPPSDHNNPEPTHNSSSISKQESCSEHLQGFFDAAASQLPKQPHLDSTELHLVFENQVSSHLLVELQECQQSTPVMQSSCERSCVKTDVVSSQEPGQRQQSPFILGPSHEGSCTEATTPTLQEPQQRQHLPSMTNSRLSHEAMCTEPATLSSRDSRQQQHLPSMTNNRLSHEAMCTQPATLASRDSRQWQQSPSVLGPSHEGSYPDATVLSLQEQHQRKQSPSILGLDLKGSCLEATVLSSQEPQQRQQSPSLLELNHERSCIEATVLSSQEPQKQQQSPSILELDHKGSCIEATELSSLEPQQRQQPPSMAEFSQESSTMQSAALQSQESQQRQQSVNGTQLNDNGICIESAALSSLEPQQGQQSATVNESKREGSCIEVAAVSSSNPQQGQKSVNRRGPNYERSCLEATALSLPEPLQQQSSRLIGLNAGPMSQGQQGRQHSISVMTVDNEGTFVDVARLNDKRGTMEAASLRESQQRQQSSNVTRLRCDGSSVEAMLLPDSQQQQLLMERTRQHNVGSSMEAGTLLESQQRQHSADAERLNQEENSTESVSLSELQQQQRLTEVTEEQSAGNFVDPVSFPESQQRQRLTEVTEEQSAGSSMDPVSFPESQQRQRLTSVARSNGEGSSAEITPVPELQQQQHFTEVTGGQCAGSSMEAMSLPEPRQRQQLPSSTGLDSKSGSVELLSLSDPQKQRNFPGGRKLLWPSLLQVNQQQHSTNATRLNSDGSSVEAEVLPDSQQLQHLTEEAQQHQERSYAEAAEQQRNLARGSKLKWPSLPQFKPAEILKSPVSEAAGAAVKMRQNIFGGRKAAQKKNASSPGPGGVTTHSRRTSLVKSKPVKKAASATTDLRFFGEVATMSRSTDPTASRRCLQAYRPEDTTATHIVILIGNSAFEHLYDVLVGLRGHSHLYDLEGEGSEEPGLPMSHAPVVILDPEGPSPTHLAEVVNIPELYHIEGSALLPSHLPRIGLTADMTMHVLAFAGLGSIEINEVDIPETHDKTATLDRARKNGNDSDLLIAIENLRLYVNRVGARMTGVANVGAIYNAPYLLPMLLDHGCYAQAFPKKAADNISHWGSQPPTGEPPPGTAADGYHISHRMAATDRSMLATTSQPAAIQPPAVTAADGDRISHRMAAMGRSMLATTSQPAATQPPVATVADSDLISHQGAASHRSMLATTSQPAVTQPPPSTAAVDFHLHQSSATYHSMLATTSQPAASQPPMAARSDLHSTHHRSFGLASPSDCAQTAEMPATTAAGFWISQQGQIRTAGPWGGAQMPVVPAAAAAAASGPQGSYLQPAGNQQGSNRERVDIPHGSDQQPMSSQQGSYLQPVGNRQGSNRQPADIPHGNDQQPTSSQQGSYLQPADNRQGSNRQPADIPQGSKQQPMSSQQGGHNEPATGGQGSHPTLARGSYFRELRSHVPFTRNASQARSALIEHYVQKFVQKYPLLAPSFAAGCLFSDSILDIILCQVFFNPTLLQLIQKLIGCWDYSLEQREDGQSPVRLRPMDLRTYVWADGSTFSHRHHCCNYSALFLDCLQQQRILLGLYRTDPKSGFTYMATSPEKDTKLRATDVLLLLCTVEALPSGSIS